MFNERAWKGIALPLIMAAKPQLDAAELAELL
jgi:hypothetical protein